MPLHHVAAQFHAAIPIFFLCVDVPLEVQHLEVGAMCLGDFFRSASASAVLPSCIQPVAEESACCREGDVGWSVAAHPPPASLVNAFTLDPRRLRGIHHLDDFSERRVGVGADG